MTPNTRRISTGNLMNVDTPTVYVVEDDAQTRESFVALFTSHGLHVTSFESGEKLLQHWNPRQLGCIVADYRLRGIDGISLHRLLSDNGCTLPLVLISGYLTVQSAVKAIEQGIYHVLEKPYRDDELISTVEAAIQKSCDSRTQNRFRLDLAHRLELLDARERLTLEMIVMGHGNRTIERRLGLSTRSVDRIRRSILDKTEYLSFVELSAAYGAVQAVEQQVAETFSPAGHAVLENPRPDTETVDHLNASLLRIQAVLLNQDVIGEESRPLLREAEVALSKAIGCMHCRRPSTSSRAEETV